MPLPKERAPEERARLKQCEADVEQAIRLVGRWSNCKHATEQLRKTLSLLWATEDGACMEGAAFYGREPWYPRGAKKKFEGEAFYEAIRKDVKMRRIFAEAGFPEEKQR